jgi:hypothetical protein
MLPRRAFLFGVSTVAAGSLIGVPAAATVSRALSLEELVGGSRLALLGTPVDVQSLWESVAGRRRIVTYTVLSVEQPLDDRTPDTGDVSVRTLGGRVGNIGQVVHGEAAFSRGERSSVFLSPLGQGVYAVTGMAQGHYLMRDDARGIARLNMSPRVSKLIRPERAAVYRLDGRTLPEAAALIVTERGKHAK